MWVSSTFSKEIYAFQETENEYEQKKYKLVRTYIVLRKFNMS